MASISEIYIWTWKSLVYNGNVAYTIFWKDFNPRQSDIPDFPSWWWANSIRTSWETTYDLSWFQYGNEVCFCSPTVEVVWLNGTTISVTMNFQKYLWWWQNAGWNDSFTFSYNANDYYQAFRYYVGIDDDEIRTDATQYRFLFTLSWWWESLQMTAPFSISWLSFDTTKHTSGYIWVDWTNLCFIDASSSSSQWYKHIINIDSSYTATSVWSDKAGHIWIPSSTSDDHIYYVDENWYTRRTKSSQTWFDENDASAGSWKEWYVWVPSSKIAENWYAHLCYVNSAWYKRRICNWEV